MDEESVTSLSGVRGSVEQRFVAPRHAFAVTATPPGGAATRKGGRLVMDLWHGEANPNRPWAMAIVAKASAAGGEPTSSYTPPESS